MTRPDNQRRLILRGTASILALGCSGLSQLLFVRSALADWPAEAFESQSAEQAITFLLQDAAASDHTESNQIQIRVPATAENGAVVPVRVSTELANVKSIAIIVPNNPTPLIASFELTPAALPEVATRMKMAADSDVVAIVVTGAGVYTSKVPVTVNIGGCSV